MTSAADPLALRDPRLVMSPESMGAVRLTKHSFSRALLRRATAESWACTRVQLDIDATGRGQAAYEVNTGDHVFTFVAFLTTLDEADHTDRVTAAKWEIAAALIEGRPDEAHFERLAREVPKQENGRLDARTLVLTRGNRSVRFFEYLVDTLAGGDQPDPDLVGDAGYIMRSTAFYGNGKFGMRSFEGYPQTHPLAVPYRAQMLAAWLYRELGYDVVESCAQKRRPETAVGFDESWRRFFGLGNATGLGMVPFAFRHPRIIDAWVHVRERALAEVRTLASTPERLDLLTHWIERARTHFATGTNESCTPFLSPAELAPLADELAEVWASIRNEPNPFDAIYRWAADHEGGAELLELVVSLLIELHVGSDDEIDAALLVDEGLSLDPTQNLGQLAAMLEEHFAWIAELDLDGLEAEIFWWVVSDNNEEPRRTERAAIKPAGREVPIDIALRVSRLRAAIDDRDPAQSVATLLAEAPEHRLAVERVQLGTVPYGEPRDNVCASGYMPLMLQRFQLAMYGMDNFKPKSTDWLRVTLFQGAPRLADLSVGGDAMADVWALPPRPAAIVETAEG